MQSGELDHLVEIIKKEQGRNTGGGLVPGWVVIGQVYASFEPVSVNSFNLSNAEGSALVIRILVRDNDFKILPEYLFRDVDTGEVYQVKGVLPLPKKRMQSCLCSMGELK